MKTYICVAAFLVTLTSSFLTLAAGVCEKKDIYITQPEEDGNNRLYDTPEVEVFEHGRNQKEHQVPLFTGCKDIAESYFYKNKRLTCMFSHDMVLYESNDEKSLILLDSSGQRKMLFPWSVSFQWDGSELTLRNPLWNPNVKNTFIFHRTELRVFVSKKPCNNHLVRMFSVVCLRKKHHNHVYGRVGTQRDLCGKDDTLWRRQFFVFAVTECSILENPKNGELSTYERTPNTAVRYICDKGYRQHPPGYSITCQSNGEWSYERTHMSCKPVDCEALNDLENGIVNGKETTFRKRVKFQCDDGYKLVGATSATCGADGYWSYNDERMPTCQVVDCGPYEIENGIVNGWETTFGNGVTFQCDDRYKLVGATSATCGADGYWRYNDERMPTCQVILCRPLSPLENGNVTTPGIYVDDQYGYGMAVGVYVSFTCNRGYDLKGSKWIKCEKEQENGEWSDNMPSCTKIKCPTPKDPKNGNVRGSVYTYDATVQFDCNQGFTLEGASQARCTEKSGWDATTPICNEIVCHDPGTPEHGSRDKETFGYGVSVTFSCDAGYIISGTESIVCDKTGHWSGQRPQCEPVECDVLYIPPTLLRDGEQREYPATVTFSCFPGYEMEGEARTSCQTNGDWSNPVPTCKACIKGFYRDSSLSVCTKCPAHSTTATDKSTTLKQCTCVAGSSGPQGGPCTIVKCERLTEPEHGRILSCDRIQDSECEVACDDGYVLSHGDRRRRCTADGWTGKPAVCTACKQNTYKILEGSTACQPCPSNMVTEPGVPGHTKAACKCAPGFRSQGTGCIDIDECKVNTGCSQKNTECENTEGSYRCYCTIPGYDLDADGRTCIMKRTCRELDQKPNHGKLNCRYTERTNGNICYVQCEEGHFFVSGENNYVTCGAESEFEWSHRRVNKTARIPACTREFFIDIDLPVTLKYQGSAGCDPAPMSKKELQKKMTETVNTLKQCRSKCSVHDLTIECSATGSNTQIKTRFDVTIYNPHPDEVPLSCHASCKRDSLVKMLGETYAVSSAIKTMVESSPKMFELSGNGVPSVDRTVSLKNIIGKPQMLCDPGQVLTRTRLCVPCDRGYYIPNRDLTTCKPCPKGTFQDELGQVMCKPCYRGTTTKDVGSDHPIMCSVKAPLSVEDRTQRELEVTEENAEAILDDPQFGLD